MKSVVMIAYWFPPEGNAAVYRPLRFLRHLPQHGWTGRVVAGDVDYERYDPDLVHQVPPGTEVTRVASRDLWQTVQRTRKKRLLQRDAARQATHGASRTPAVAGLDLRSRLRGLVYRAESTWYHPDRQAPWIGPAVAATVATCARNRPHVLWATGPPWSAFIVAQRAGQQAGVPYVLDFRTSWTVVPSASEAIRPGWARSRDRRLLRDLLKGAQAITFFYAAEAECFWRIYQDVLDVARIHIIPNGFEGEIERFAEPSGERLTVLYTGTLSDYRYDTFLEALVRFRNRDARRARQIAIQFVGEVEPPLIDGIARLGLSDIVSVQPPVPQREIATLQRAAHALLMLERKPTHKGYELLAGAKLFGYLRTGRPILGVLPPGEAARILRSVGVSTVADASSVEAIVAALETIYAAWRDRRLASLVPDPSACGAYSAMRQTGALVRALDGLPSPEPFVPGRVDVVPSLRAEFAAAGWA